MTANDNQKDNDRSKIEPRGRWHSERRDEMANHGLRSLLLLNGGGAVAVLAFLQSIWTEPAAQELVPWVVYGMVPLIIGAALSGLVHFIRYESSEAYQMRSKMAGRRMKCLQKFFTAAAFASFLFGMNLIVFGALQNLPSPGLSGQVVIDVPTDAQQP